jgi:anti-sigma factor RsiW
MEHREVRSRLKEYAADRITSREAMDEMAVHIEKCEICKRELMLWQDVMAKRRENERLTQYIPEKFRDRVKYRMDQLEKEKNLPPPVVRMRAMQKAFTSTTGRLVIQISILLLGFVWFLFVMKKGTNLISLFFLIAGFGALFFLVLKKKK